MLDHRVIRHDEDGIYSALYLRSLSHCFDLDQTARCRGSAPCGVVRPPMIVDAAVNAHEHKPHDTTEHKAQVTQDK